MQAVTTATVQFAVKYVPQCFNANDPYSVLSIFIIIMSMPKPYLCKNTLQDENIHINFILQPGSDWLNSWN